MTILLRETSTLYCFDLNNPKKEAKGNYDSRNSDVL